MLPMAPSMFTFRWIWKNKCWQVKFIHKYRERMHLQHNFLPAWHILEKECVVNHYKWLEKFSMIVNHTTTYISSWVWFSSSMPQSRVLCILNWCIKSSMIVQISSHKFLKNTSSQAFQRCFSTTFEQLFLIDIWSGLN